MTTLTDNQQAAIRYAKLAQDQAVSAVESAITCGEYLIQVKAGMKHGEYLPWIDATEELPARKQCSLYVNLAENKELLNGYRGTHLELPSIKGALRIINPPKPKAQPDPEPVQPIVEEAPVNIPKAKTIDAATFVDRIFRKLPKSLRDERAARREQNKLPTPAEVGFLTVAKELQDMMADIDPDEHKGLIQACNHVFHLNGEVLKAMAADQVPVMIQRREAELKANTEALRRREVSCEKWEQAHAEGKVYRVATARGPVLTTDELKIIKQALHPDQNPSDMAAKAISIVNKLFPKKRAT